MADAFKTSRKVSVGNQTFRVFRVYFKPIQMSLCLTASSGIRKPDLEKLAAVQNLLPPTNKKQVRQITFLFSYFREYIPNFAQLAFPLTELTKKKSLTRFLGALKNKVHLIS